MGSQLSKNMEIIHHTDILSSLENLKKNTDMSIHLAVLIHLSHPTIYIL